MRKEIVGALQSSTVSADDDWLDLDQVARVEVTSEDPAHPIESALLLHGQRSSSGWRAATAGQQTIRLLFDEPQPLRRIWLRFLDDRAARTQEFVLRWSPDGQSYREIVRQQWNFSPTGGQCEIEDYRVELARVLAVELTIIPDVQGGDAHASLTHLRLA